MKHKTEKGTPSVSGTHGVVGVIPKTLNDLRAHFDGFRDVAAKMEESKIKNQLLTGIEELYLSAANWFTGIHAKPTENSAA